MRTLTRPMFNIGGPIKQGIMHGIREPHKHGGLSQQFNTGLVGDERYPKTKGREHHVGFLAPLLWGGARMLARPFARQVIKQLPKFTKDVSTTNEWLQVVILIPVHMRVIWFWFIVFTSPFI